MSSRKRYTRTNASIQGFTVLELIAVVALLAIASTLVLAAIGNTRERARDVRRIGDLIQLKLALEFYRDTHGVFPTSANGGGAGQSSKDPINNINDCGGWSEWDAGSQFFELQNQGYIPTLPLDPINEGNYCYRYWSNPAEVGACAWAQLESGERVGIVAGDPVAGVGAGFPQGFVCGDVTGGLNRIVGGGAGGIGGGGGSGGGGSGGGGSGG